MMRDTAMKESMLPLFLRTAARAGLSSTGRQVNISGDGKVVLTASRHVSVGQRHIVTRASVSV